MHLLIFGRKRHRTAVFDNNFARGCTPKLTVVLDHVINQIGSFEDNSKGNILSIKPLRFRGVDEKLRPVGVAPAICHGDESPGIVPDGKALVFKDPSPDRLATSSIMENNITSYNCAQNFSESRNRREFRHSCVSSEYRNLLSIHRIT